MLAVIAVGRGFIASSLRTRRWQVWVSLHHNKDSAAPVPGRVCPRIVANFDAFRFANPGVLQIPCRSGHTASIDRLNCGQIGANSSEICGFSAQPFSRVRALPRDDRRHVFHTQFPRSLAEKPGRRDNAWQQAAERNFLRLVCVFSRGAHVQSPHAGAQTDLWWSLAARDRKSTRLNSSHVAISYAVFCLKKKKKQLKLHSL